MTADSHLRKRGNLTSLLPLKRNSVNRKPSERTLKNHEEDAEVHEAELSTTDGF